MASKEPKLTFAIEPFPMVDLTSNDPVAEPPVKEEKTPALPTLSEYEDPPPKPLVHPAPVWISHKCGPMQSLEEAALPPQDPEMAWVIVQSLGTAFAIGGLVGALLAYSFSKNIITEYE